jgi:hypothetical protein
MAAKTVRAEPEATEAPVRPVLEVLLLYEDLGTAIRARHLLDRLPGQLGRETDFNTRLWRLDLLGQPLLAEQAAIEAAAADVIILSLHGRGDLPTDVRNWLNRWLDHKEDRPYALAASLDAEPTEARDRNPLVDDLRQFAASAGVDLFFGVGRTLVPSTQPFTDSPSAFC